MVVHLTQGLSSPLKDVFNGGEAQRMTPEIASNIEVLNNPLLCWFDAESCETEVALLGRSLDVLVNAEIPGAGENATVAIENQYGIADPDHFGRLIGWYMPEINADMGVLIAESFDPHLIRAVSEGRIVRPKYGLWLIQATGFIVDQTPAVSYTMAATSLAREDVLRRQSSYKKNQAFALGNNDARESEMQNRIEALFRHIAETGDSWLSNAVGREKTRSKFYRWLRSGDCSTYVGININSGKIAISSGSINNKLSPETVHELREMNNTIQLDVNPTKRSKDSISWVVESIGYDTPVTSWPSHLGDLLQTEYDTLEASIGEHQQRIIEISRKSQSGQ